MYITKLQENKKTIVITFSDGEVLKLPLLAKIDFLLYEGKEVDPKLRHELTTYSRQQKDYQYALRIISRFNYTTFEIKTKLRQRGALEEDIREITAKLTDLGYLNDDEYTKERVRFLSNVKKESKKMIINKLKEKGIDEKLVMNYVDDTSEEEIIYELARKVIIRYTKHSINYAKDKLTTYLMRRGFKYEDIKKVTQEFPFTTLVPETENIYQDFHHIKIKKVPKQTERSNARKILYNELMKLKYSSHLINNILEELDDEN